MKTRLKYIITSLVLFLGCTKEEVTPRVYPRVNTSEAFDITSEGATFRGEIIFSSVEIKDHGFIWSDGTTLLVEYSNKISLGGGAGVGVFESRCDRSLEAGKKYYVRAYAISEDFVVYGKTVEFVSLGSKAPVVKDFFPITGTWGDTITVVGENFSNENLTNKVKFGDSNGKVVRSSKDTLLVEVPNDLTTETSNVSVTLFGNGANLPTKAFTLEGPIIESISPAEGSPGSTVTLIGKFLNSSATKVYFNGIEGLVWSSTQTSVRAKSPNSLSPATVEVKVVTGSGDMFDITSFIVKQPELLQITPINGGEGDEITLTGKLFSPEKSDNVVTFDNSAALVTSATTNELKVIVPPNVNAINANVKVKIGNTETAPIVFSFLPPVIESFTPMSGYATSVTITGKYFRVGSYNEVFIGDVRLANVYASSSTKIEGYLNKISSTHTGKVKVEFSSQQGISAQDFKIPWAQLPDYPDQWAEPTATFINNSNAYTGFGTGEFNKLWSFNSNSKVWTQMANFPGQSRNGFAFFSAGSKGYFGGGYVNSSLDDWWEYNFNNNSWTQKADLPIPGALSASFEYSGTGYVLAFDPATSTTNSSLWKYDHTNDSWSIVSTAPFSLNWEPRCFFADNELYTIAENDVWKYNFGNNKWTRLNPQQNDEPHMFMTIGGTAYGVGNYNQLKKFSPSLNSWTFEPSPLSDYSIAPSVLFVVNGRGYAIIRNVVLEYEP